MEPNEQQNKSTRTFEEWKEALTKLVERKDGHCRRVIDDDRIKSYYDQCLMPEVCFKELFNR